MDGGDLADLVVEVLHQEPGGSWWVGSGYCVGGARVLTASHNVGPGDLFVRAGERESPATVLVAGTEEIADLAVLELSAPWVIAPPCQYGAVDRRSRARVERCSAVGFPKFKERDPEPGERKPVRYSTQVDGVIPT